MSDEHANRLGWIGAGRMGHELCARLLAAGHDVAVYNRTRAKAEPLADLGASLVDSPAELADRDIVFTMVGGSADFEEVVSGDDGLLSRSDAAPRIIVDSTTISPTAAAARPRGRRDSRDRRARSTGQRQPAGRGGRPADDRLLRPRGRVAHGAALPRAVRIAE